MALLLLAVALAGITINRMRVWNPSRQMRMSALEAEPAVAADDSKTSKPLPLPLPQHANIEPSGTTPLSGAKMCTRAYGRRMVWIKLIYVLLVISIGLFASQSSKSGSGDLVLGMVTPPAFAFLGIGIMSLLLLNAQAVTSITNERDGRTLEPLLITGSECQRIHVGKIGGSLWNARKWSLCPSCW